MIFKFLTTLLFTLLVCTVQGQMRYYEEWFSAELESIPQNSIKSIVPDKYGFIWITTENGLLRFDGRNFKVYNNDGFDLVSNRFAYISGNIQKDSLTTHTAYHVDQLDISNRTIRKRKITADDKNRPYNNIKFYDEILYYRDYLNDGKSDFKNIKIKCVNGDYYLPTEENISFYNKENKLLKQINKKFEYNTVYFLFENQLILLNYNDFTYTLFDNNFDTAYKLIIPKKCKIIYNYMVQQLFVVLDNKILLLNKKSDKIFFTTVFAKPKINLNVKSLYFDQKSNKLFIGTIDKGLNVISKSSFKTLINPKNIYNNFYGSFPVSETEFVTTKGEFFNKNGIVSTFKVNNTNQMQSITVDKDKNIWIPNGADLVKYLKSSNYKTFVNYNFKYNIGAIYCDQDNKIWIGMNQVARHNARAFTIDANNTNARPIAIKDIKNPVIFFAPNNKGDMLMVCINEILIFNLKSQKATSIAIEKNEVRSLFVAQDNSVWACSFNNGLSLLANNILHKMPIDNKMYLSSTHCIAEDKIGHFWITTNKGLIEVSKSSLLGYYKNKTPVYYHHYNVVDGFLTNEFNGGCQPCGIKLDNNFIFPTLNGMVLYNPQTVEKIVPSDNFFINEAELDGKSHYFTDTLNIKRSVNRVNFKIDFPYLGNQDNIFFEAKLAWSGNEKWIKIQEKNEIIYTNLPPGNYPFLVRKIKAFGTEYEIKKVIVSIPFLYYETLTFKILIASLLILLLFSAAKFRSQILRQKNIKLEREIKTRTSDLFETVSKLRVTKNNLNQEILQQKKLIGTISHDIKSPLKFLSITAKHLYEKSLESGNQTIEDNAKIMQESATELYRFVENLVDYSKVFMENNDISESRKENITLVIQEKINLFKNLASENNVTIIYNDIKPYAINLNYRILGIIMHNLLDNAIKNTFDGSIIIEANLYKNKIFISVEDTGIGMSDEIKEYYANIQKNFETDKLALQNYGLGLHMVLELLRLLKGDLKIQSKEGVGTKITIVIDN